MSGDTANPRIWEGADVYVAPVGTSVVADLETFDNPWPAGWEALGLLSEDGASETRDQETSDHYAWGGILVRTKKGKHKRSIKITALEDNLVVFGLVNPGSLTSTDETGLTTRTVMNPTDADPRSFGLELHDGTVTTRRLIPSGEVVEVGEVALSDSEMTAYELTINIYPDAAGILYYDLTDDPQADENWS